MEIPKTYLAKLDGQPSEKELNRLLSGVHHSRRSRKKAGMWSGQGRRFGKICDWIKILSAKAKTAKCAYVPKIGYGR